MNPKRYIDPASTQQLIDKLCLAIDKTKLVLAINELDEKIRKMGTEKIKPVQLAKIQQQKSALTSRLNCINETVDQT